LDKVIVGLVLLAQNQGYANRTP